MTFLSMWLIRLTSPTVMVAGLPTNLTYDTILSALLQTCVFLANLAGGLVVGVAIFRGLFTYVRDLVVTRGGAIPKEEIRLSLGRSLALALEFQLGADILATALNPSPKDIAVLAAIAALRTALNFFLGRELAEAQRRAEIDAPGMAVSDEPSPDIERELVRTPRMNQA